MMRVGKTRLLTVLVVLIVGGVLALTVGGFAARATTPVRPNSVAIAWGSNSYGQLGNGTTTNSSVPVSVNTAGVLAGKTITQVAAGYDSACAVTSEGKVACWGANLSGQLGNGTTTNSSVPVLVNTSGVLAGKTVTEVSVGSSSTSGSSATGSSACARTSEGKVVCWGANTHGQLGNGTTTNSSVPVLVNTTGVLAGKSVTEVSVGSSSATGTSACARTSEGKAVCWGANTYGQLGNGTTTNSSVPVSVNTAGVLAGKTITQVSVGAALGCAVTSEGKVTCWGGNISGQLGNGTTTNSSVPVSVNTAGVLAGKTVTQVSAGTSFSCALTSEGKAVCWGYNQTGQLGIGTTTNSSIPVSVSTAGVLAGKTITQVSAGAGLACAVTSEGTANCWGYNYWGQLGNGSTTNSSVPVTVNTSGVLVDRGVSSVSAGRNSVLAIAAPVPSAPKAVAAKPGDRQATISFEAPSSDGGAALTNYEYSIDNGVTFTARTPASTASPVVITELVNGRTYLVRLRAVNRYGAGTPSVAVAVTPRTVPGAPTGLVATPGDKQTSVSFAAPSSNGGAALTNYEYSTDDGATWTPRNPTSTASPMVIGGLVNGQTYQVRLRAVNASGAGASSDPVTARVGAPPGAPTALVATPGDTQISLAFTPPISQGTTPITNYEYSIDDGGTWTPRTPTATTSPVMITNLTNGRTYQVRLRAVNDYGPSTPSGAVAVTPRAMPGAPSISSATPGNRQAFVSFGAPTSDGGSPITNYEYSTNNGATWAPRNPASTASPMVIGGLVNGQTYQVRLRAVNAAGTGALSNAVMVTPRTVPSAPTGLVAKPEDKKTSVSFIAPASDGSSAITNYEYSTDDGATWTRLSPASTTSPMLIGGLVNGQTYQVRLRAVNAAGTGAQSDPVAVTPRTVPSAPTGLVATLGDKQTSVSFAAPASNGGASLTNYEYSTDDGATWAPRNPTSTASPMVIGGLVNGQTYQVRLRAVNASGAGASSDPVTARVGAPPGAPTALVATPGDTQISLAFTPPISQGTTPITNYEYSIDDGGTWTPRTPTATTSPVMITNLTNGRTYQVRLRAVNDYGPSTPSGAVAVTPRAMPGAPSISSATPGNRQAFVSFGAPTSDGGSPITNYEYSTNNGATWAPRNPASTASPMVIGGLVNGQTYQVRLRAVNAAGAGTASDPVAVTPRTEPNSPTIAVSWGANADGQLGDGNTQDVDMPVWVDTTGILAGKSITQVSAGANSACAVTSEGKIACWGANSYGQLGDGTTTSSSVPVWVNLTGELAGKTISHVTVGAYFACAVTSEGRVACWGWNYFGQLGNGTAVDSLVPVAVDTTGVLAGKTISHVSAGSSSACAVTSEGKIACWGDNNDGQLGNGTTASSLIPVMVNTTGVLAGKTISQVTVGAYFACAVNSEGKVSCWGYNYFGQLGNGTSANSNVPVSVNTSGVLAAKTITHVSAGSGTVCAATSEGKASCWGYNANGQLGNGTRANSNTPILVNATGVLAGDSVAGVSVGGNSSCAATSKGRVACWGANSAGQLGNGTRADSSVPVAVDTSGVLAHRDVMSLSTGQGSVYAVATSLPSAPTNVVAVAGNGQTSVSFTAPTSSGGSPLRNYEYSTDDGLTWTPRNPQSTQSPAIIAGLVNGTTYKVRLRAVNSAGPGAASMAVSVTPVTTPNAPTGLSATPGNGQASIVFVAPASTGGAQISNYEYSTNNGTTWVARTPASTTSPVVITGLVNGTTYQVKLRAVNTAGPGTPSAAVAVTPVTTPSAPTGLAATPGNEQAFIAFVAPANTGGLPISNYEYSTDDGATWTARTPASTTSPIVIGGLTNGTTYQVKLRAVNTAGPGAASSAVGVTPVAPVTVPGSPSGLVATPGNGQASIAFVAPANTGGAPITNYEYSINNGTSWTARNPAATGSPLLIGGLTNGTTYQVRLRAVNSAGPGAASAAVSVTPVAPVTVPGSPSGLVATPGNGQASVAFVAPANTGGAPITNYEYSINNGTSWTPRNPAATESPIVITSLTNGTAYQVKLRAVNSAGPGAASTAVSVTPVTVPGAPTGLVATAGNGQASVAFVASANTGGAPITNYEFSTNNGTSWTARNPAASGSPLVIGGLTNGTTYQVKLRAVNAAGAGAPSTAVGVTPVAPPTGAVFVPSAPIRAYDSRNTGGALAKDQSRVVDVKVAGYPAGTVAIAYNVTVTDTVGAGWLAVTPGDATGAPTASTINWDSPNATLANGYVVGVSPAGAVRVVAGGHVGSGTQFVIDVVGFYIPDTPGTPGAVFVPVDPARAYNSITSGGPLGSGQTRNVSVAPGGVPAGATGVAYNLTVTNTSQQGWLAVTPQGTPASGSSINWTQPGQTYANGTQGQIASNAVTVTAGGGGSTDFIIDVTGYFVPVGQDGGKGTRFTPLAPVRAFDSRAPGGGGRLNSQASRTTSMTTGTGVPVGAAAVVYNLTETETASGGYLAVAPGGATTNASTINWFRTGQDMANGTVVKLNPTGQVTTTAGGGGSSGLGSTQYLIDIAGYYR